MGKYLNDEIRIDLQVSLNTFGSGTFDSMDSIIDDSELKAYRLWLRFATPQFEARVGLQKINFGTALLLRPLMWFDRIDPRDPLNLTDGIYGLLLRYTFLNNANAWLWGLYDNDDTKGWEVIPAKDNSIEFGGRLQYPLLTGEIAFSYHHREVDLFQNPVFTVLTGDSIVPENRFALDGTWDVGVGLWFESVVIHQDLENLPFVYRNFFLIGSDYTFDLGNGLHLLAEHLLLGLSDEPFGTDEEINVSAWSADYSLGLLDRLRAIVYYNWEQSQLSRYVSWGRFYDNWSIFVNAFWSPDEINAIGFQSETQTSFGTGKGVQLLVVFNH